MSERMWHFPPPRGITPQIARGMAADAVEDLWILPSCIVARMQFVLCCKIPSLVFLLRGSDCAGHWDQRHSVASLLCFVSSSVCRTNSH